MYNILIVDDEKKEREGIALLLKRFGFPLRTAFAQNGEDALKIMEKNYFDILLTDIKMPYMDGIQLIRETQKRGLNPICIIYSAYGEFEYAQNAISLGVQEYLLKPVKLDAFKALFEKIIEICQEKEIEKKNRNDIIQVKEEAAQQKLSWNLLNYLESEELEEGTLNHWETLENEFTSVVQEKICIPVIISCYSNLFSIEWEEYLKDIREYFGKETVILTNTDNQIVVLLIRERDLQSKHFPAVLQGVFTSNLCAFAGAATFLARFIAASRSEQTLFIPTMKTTFFGPWAIQETRLEFPSMFTITPSLVMAFALERNTSASYAAIRLSLGDIFARLI